MPTARRQKFIEQLKKRTGLHIPVIIADSFGRPWREGLCDVAIGVAGMQVIHDYRGKRDRYGYKMHATEEAVADELASVAGLVCGKDARVPACIIRGYRYSSRQRAARGSWCARRRRICSGSTEFAGKLCTTSVGPIGRTFQNATWDDVQHRVLP